jgi:hypothetical protein
MWCALAVPRVGEDSRCRGFARDRAAETAYTVLTVGMIVITGRSDNLKRWRQLESCFSLRAMRRLTMNEEQGKKIRPVVSESTCVHAA